MLLIQAGYPTVTVPAFRRQIFGYLCPESPLSATYCTINGRRCPTCLPRHRSSGSLGGLDRYMPHMQNTSAHRTASNRSIISRPSPTHSHRLSSSALGLAALSLFFGVETTSFSFHQWDFPPSEWTTNANRRRHAPWLTMRSVLRKGAECPRATMTLRYVRLSRALDITSLGMACCLERLLFPTGNRPIVPRRSAAYRQLLDLRRHACISRIANIRACRISQREKRPKRRPPSASNSSSKSAEPPTRGAPDPFRATMDRVRS